MIFTLGKNRYCGTAESLEALCDWAQAYLIDTLGPEEGARRYRALTFLEAMALWEQHGEGRVTVKEGEA